MCFFQNTKTELIQPRLTTVVTTFLFALTLSGCNLDFFKTAEDLKLDAEQALNLKNFSEAAKAAQRWIEKAPMNFEGQFALAQAKAQTGEKNAAIVALEQAIKLGLKDSEKIVQCANLEPIKSLSAYKDLMNGSFPNRVGVEKNELLTSGDGVSIQTGNENQVIRAGDVVIEVHSPK